MINYDLTYEYDDYQKGFITFNKGNPIGLASLIIIFNISGEKTKKLLDQINFEHVSPKQTMFNMAELSIFKFLTDYDAKLFIERLEAELLIKILSNETEELTVSQMIKLL